MVIVVVVDPKTFHGGGIHVFGGLAGLVPSLARMPLVLIVVVDVVVGDCEGCW